MSTFDFSDPFIILPGMRKIDCRNLDDANYYLIEYYSDKQAILASAQSAAQEDFASGVKTWEDKKKTHNPYNKFLSPNKWTCWNCGYCSVMKYYICS